MKDVRDPAMPHLTGHLGTTLPIAHPERPSESRDFKPLLAPRPITEQQWPEGTRPLVSICCTCYNHKEFLLDAIEGFLTQQTTFPVEIIIHDDASADRSADIIHTFHAKYPQLFHPILQTQNQWTKGRSTLKICFAAARGEYIAICEGDDYWTSPHKLQKQVDFLDAQPCYVLCAHRFQVLDETTHLLSEDMLDSVLQGRPHIETNYQNFLNPYVTKTLTVIFRTEALKGNFKKPIGMDTVLWAHLLSQGQDGVVLNNVMGVYRKHAGGICSAINGLARHEFGLEQMAAIVLHEGFASRCVRSEYLFRAQEISDHWIAELGKGLAGLDQHTCRVLKSLPAGYTPGILDYILHRMVLVLDRALAEVWRLRAESILWAGTKPHPTGRGLRLPLRLIVWLVSLWPLMAVRGCKWLLRRLRPTWPRSVERQIPND
jgi:glycosyltransferase involved in cell wall biosynthesis